MSDTSSKALMTLDDAIQNIIASLTPIRETIVRPIREALNQTLGQPVISPLQVPPFDNSAMDGYAIRFADYQGSDSIFEQIGTAFAGHPFAGTVQAGQCVRIMTGAALPNGADTVVMQEHCQNEGTRIQIHTPPRQADNVRYAGEDVKVGTTILSRGTHLQASHIGLLASLGVAEVSIVRPLRVAFFSTGDELIGLGQALAPGQIYDSNRYALHSLLNHLGVEILDLGSLPDNRQAIEDAFRQAMRCADVLLTSGGVSVGDADYVTETLQQLGQVHFWRLAIKPGKPLAFGHLDKTVFFGLPGNPVSAMATFYEIVLPGLHQLMGRPFQPRLRFQVRLASRLKKAAGRLEFQRGHLQYASNGELQVSSTGGQGSHMMTSMSQANCFILLGKDRAGAEVGEMVEVEPFYGIL